MAHNMPPPPTVTYSGSNRLSTPMVTRARIRALLPADIQAFLRDTPCSAIAGGFAAAVGWKTEQEMSVYACLPLWLADEVSCKLPVAFYGDIDLFIAVPSTKYLKASQLARSLNDSGHFDDASDSDDLSVSTTETESCPATEACPSCSTGGYAVQNPRKYVSTSGKSFTVDHHDHFLWLKDHGFVPQHGGAEYDFEGCLFRNFQRVADKVQVTLMVLGEKPINGHNDLGLVPPTAIIDTFDLACTRIQITPENDFWKFTLTASSRATVECVVLPCPCRAQSTTKRITKYISRGFPCVPAPLVCAPRLPPPVPSKMHRRLSYRVLLKDALPGIPTGTHVPRHSAQHSDDLPCNLSLQREEVSYNCRPVEMFARALSPPVKRPRQR